MTQSNVIDGTVQMLWFSPELCFPSITLIRLYELLKNDSRFAMNRWRKQPRADPGGLRQRSIEAMVEDDGIEPTTPCLQSRCSPS